MRGVFTYLRERKIWSVAGKPRRPRAERKRITDLCHDCRYFSGDICRKCGCPVGLESEKVIWATTRCPALPRKWGEWGPVRERAMRAREQVLRIKHDGSAPQPRRGCGGCR